MEGISDKNMAGIKDVAKAAGVSISTVSYVFNGKRSISTEVRDKVMKTAEELGYAGGNRRKGSQPKLIGLYGCNVKNMGTNIHIHQILRGVFEVLEGTEYNILVIPEEKEKSLADIFDAFTLPKLSGVILVEPKMNVDYYSFFYQRKLPLVLIGRPNVNEMLTTYVDVDNISLGYRSVRYLLDRKVSELLFLNGPEDLTVSDDKKRGVYLALEEEGLPYDTVTIENINFLQEEAYQKVKSIFSEGKPYAGIIASNDLQAVGALDALRDCGYKCPQDVSLFCGTETFLSICTTPRISGMDVKSVEIGKSAADLLIKMINRELIKASHVSISADMTERDSVK